MSRLCLPKAPAEIIYSAPLLRRHMEWFHFHFRRNIPFSFKQYAIHNILSYYQVYDYICFAIHHWLDHRARIIVI